MPNLTSKIVRRKPNLLACQASSLIAPLGNNYLERGFRSRVKKGKGIDPKKWGMSVCVKSVQRGCVHSYRPSTLGVDQG